MITTRAPDGKRTGLKETERRLGERRRLGEKKLEEKSRTSGIKIGNGLG